MKTFTTYVINEKAGNGNGIDLYKKNEQGAYTAKGHDCKKTHPHKSHKAWAKEEDYVDTNADINNLPKPPAGGVDESEAGDVKRLERIRKKQKKHSVVPRQSKKTPDDQYDYELRRSEGKPVNVPKQTEEVTPEQLKKFFATGGKITKLPPRAARGSSKGQMKLGGSRTGAAVLSRRAHTKAGRGLEPKKEEVEIEEDDRPLRRGTSRIQKQMARDQADKRVAALKASGKFKKSPRRKKPPVEKPPWVKTGRRNEEVENLDELTPAQKVSREKSRHREFGGKAGKVSKYDSARHQEDPGAHHPGAKKQRGATGPDSDYHHGSQATGTSKAQELRGFKGMTATQKYYHLDTSAKAKLLKKARRTAKARRSATEEVDLDKAGERYRADTSKTAPAGQPYSKTDAKYKRDKLKKKPSSDEKPFRPLGRPGVMYVGGKRGPGAPGVMSMDYTPDHDGETLGETKDHDKYSSLMKKYGNMPTTSVPYSDFRKIEKLGTKLRGKTGTAARPKKPLKTVRTALSDEYKASKEQEKKNDARLARIDQAHRDTRDREKEQARKTAARHSLPRSGPRRKGNEPGFRGHPGRSPAHGEVEEESEYMDRVKKLRDQNPSNAWPPKKPRTPAQQREPGEARGSWPPKKQRKQTSSRRHQTTMPEKPKYPKRADYSEYTPDHGETLDEGWGESPAKHGFVGGPTNPKTNKKWTQGEWEKNVNDANAKASKVDAERYRRQQEKKKKKSIGESYADECSEGQYFCNDEQKCKPIPSGHKVMADGELVKIDENLDERVTVDGRMKGYRDAVTRIAARHQLTVTRVAVTEPEPTDDSPDHGDNIEEVESLSSKLTGPPRKTWPPKSKPRKNTRKKFPSRKYPSGDEIKTVKIKSQRHPKGKEFSVGETPGGDVVEPMEKNKLIKRRERKRMIKVSTKRPITHTTTDRTPEGYGPTGEGVTTRALGRAAHVTRTINAVLPGKPKTAVKAGFKAFLKAREIEKNKQQGEAFGSVPGMVPTENLTTSKRKGAKGMLKHAYDTQAMEKRLRLAARKNKEKAMNVLSPGSVARSKAGVPKKPSLLKRAINKWDSTGGFVANEYDPDHGEMFNEARMGEILKNVKKGTPPYSIVAHKTGRVVGQELTKTAQAVPAFVREMQKEYPNAKISVEDRRGRVLHSESINEINWMVNVSGIGKIILDGKSSSEVKTKLRKMLRHKDDIGSIERMTDPAKKKYFRQKATGKEEEKVDEAKYPGYDVDTSKSGQRVIKYKSKAPVHTKHLDSLSDLHKDVHGVRPGRQSFKKVKTMGDYHQTVNTLVNTERENQKARKTEKKVQRKRSFGPKNYSKPTNVGAAYKRALAKKRG